MRGSELYVAFGEWDERERGMIIAELELLASTLGLVTIAPYLGTHEVYEFTDNMVCLSGLRSLAPSTPRMQELIARRVEWLEGERIVVAAERISSKNNLWADMLSRGEAEAVAEQAAALELTWRRLYPPAAWLDPLTATLTSLQSQ